MDAKKLVRFTGISRPNIEDQAAEALVIVEAMVSAYTRGRHKRADGSFREGVEAVITTAASRILSNPEQVSVREQVGPYSMYRGEGFQGFSLAERMVLDRYRKSAL